MCTYAVLCVFNNHEMNNPSPLTYSWLEAIHIQGKGLYKQMSTKSWETTRHLPATVPLQLEHEVTWSLV